MKFLDKFNQAFGFTRTESRVIVFLVATFLVGLGIKALQSGTHRAQYDYSDSDSEFVALSRSASDGSIDSGSIGNAQDASAGSLGPSVVKPRSTPLNINTATKEELVALPGIGDAMAERIILYREENGPIHSLDELTHIKGIGKKKLERIAPLCTTGK